MLPDLLVIIAIRAATIMGMRLAMLGAILAVTLVSAIQGVLITSPH